MNLPRDHRRAAALQGALERYEHMLAEGISPDEARLAIVADLPEEAADLALAVGVAAGLREKGRAFTPAVDPEFRAALAARLRTTGSVTPMRSRSRQRAALVPLAAAACIALFAALLVPSMRSLPGDPLYGVKGFAEDARVLFAAGASEARVRVELAEERFSEVEQLLDRPAVRAVGVFAASVENISDPELAHLIDEALQEAGRQLEAAADILTTQPSSAEDLDELVAVSQRGHLLASAVADELPNREQQSPVLDTVVKLAKIQAAAKAARTKAEPEPTLEPCDTPAPSPDVTATPTVSPAQTATPTAVESATPSPAPTDTPKPTPCATPQPTATPKPTEPGPTSEPTGSPGVDEGEGVNGDDGGEDVGMSDDGQVDGSDQAGRSGQAGSSAA